MTSKQQKKIAMEDEKERSTDVHFYSVVGEKVTDKYHNKPEEVYTELTTNRNPQAIYSSLPQNKNADFSLKSKSMSEYEQSNKKLKKDKCGYRVWFCLTILVLFLLVVISLVISIVISLTMRSSSAVLLNEEFMKKIENNTQSNYLKILAIEKELNEYRKSDLFSFNITNIETFITDRDLDLLVLVQQLNESSVTEHAFLNDKLNQINRTLLSGKTESFPAPSCRVIYLVHPKSTSGYYWVTSSNGSSVRVYCEMTKSCGNITGGLTRVALLNNEIRPTTCMGSLMTVNQNTRCVRTTEDSGCSSIFSPLENIRYSHVCGMVEAYFHGLPDGFIGQNRSFNTTINDNYVDGISLTYGQRTNRTHIWTLIADEGNGNPRCPREVPDYVGSNYLCLNWLMRCTSSPNSCSYKFFRQFQQPVTEDIEMRLCQDEVRHIEIVYVANFTIYVW